MQFSVLNENHSCLVVASAVVGAGKHSQYTASYIGSKSERVLFVRSNNVRNARLFHKLSHCVFAKRSALAASSVGPKPFGKSALTKSRTFCLIMHLQTGLEQNQSIKRKRLFLTGSFQSKSLTNWLATLIGRTMLAISARMFCEDTSARGKPPCTQKTCSSIRAHKGIASNARLKAWTRKVQQNKNKTTQNKKKNLKHEFSLFDPKCIDAFAVKRSRSIGSLVAVHLRVFVISTKKKNLSNPWKTKPKHADRKCTFVGATAYEEGKLLIKQKHKFAILFLLPSSKANEEPLRRCEVLCPRNPPKTKSWPWPTKYPTEKKPANRDSTCASLFFQNQTFWKLIKSR